MKFKFKALIIGEQMTTEVEGRAIGQTSAEASNYVRKGLAKQFSTDTRSIEIEVTEL